MSTETPGKPFRCWQCGSDLLPPVERCSCCGARIPSQTEVLEAPIQRRRSQFTIAAMLAMMTLLAVLLSCWNVHPALGAVLMIVSVPAFVWTYRITLFNLEQGVTVSWRFRTMLFVLACLVSLVLLVGIVAYLVVGPMSHFPW